MLYLSKIAAASVTQNVKLDGNGGDSLEVLPLGNAMTRLVTSRDFTSQACKHHRAAILAMSTLCFMTT